MKSFQQNDLKARNVVPSWDLAFVLEPYGNHYLRFSSQANRGPGRSKTAARPAKDDLGSALGAQPNQQLGGKTRKTKTLPETIIPNWESSTHSRPSSGFTGGCCKESL